MALLTVQLSVIDVVVASAKEISVGGLPTSESNSGKDEPHHK